MCISCGCNSPNDDHGDSRNITMDQLRRAAEAVGKSPGEVASNIQRAAGRSA